MQRARLATKREHSLAGRRVHLTAAAAANIQANMWGAAGGHSTPELSITIPAAEANQAQTHTSAGKHFGWASAEMKPGRYFRRPSRAPTSQVKCEAQQQRRRRRPKRGTRSFSVLRAHLRARARLVVRRAPDGATRSGNKERHSDGYIRRLCCQIGRRRWTGGAGSARLGSNRRRYMNADLC